MYSREKLINPFFNIPIYQGQTILEMQKRRSHRDEPHVRHRTLVVGHYHNGRGRVL